MKKEIEEEMKHFNRVILFCFGIGGITILFCLGAAGLAFLEGKVETATRMLNEWLIPMWLGGTIGSLLSIILYERIRKRRT